MRREQQNRSITVSIGILTILISLALGVVSKSIRQRSDPNHTKFEFILGERHFNSLEVTT